MRIFFTHVLIVYGGTLRGAHAQREPSIHRVYNLQVQEAVYFAASSYAHNASQIYSLPQKVSTHTRMRTPDGDGRVMSDEGEGPKRVILIELDQGHRKVRYRSRDFNNLKILSLPEAAVVFAEQATEPPSTLISRELTKADLENILGKKMLERMSRLLKKVIIKSPIGEEHGMGPEDTEIEAEYIGLHALLQELVENYGGTLTQNARGNSFEAAAEHEYAYSDVIGGLIDQSVPRSKNPVSRLNRGRAALVSLPLGINEFMKIISSPQERTFEVFESGPKRFMWIAPGTALIGGVASAAVVPFGDGSVLHGHNHPEYAEAEPSVEDIQVARRDEVQSGKMNFIVSTDGYGRVQLSLYRNGQFEFFHHEPAIRTLVELGIIKK